MSEPTTGARVRQGAVRSLMAAGSAAHNVAARLNTGQPTLDGARWVEWSFCFARMADGPGTTLDFGADVGFLAMGAAWRGHDVVALDRLPTPLAYAHERVSTLTGDVLDRPWGERRFDQIVNCSTVEHVGLAGRYESFARPDGDHEAMAALRGALAPGGRMILTIPVGRDAVIDPLHRIYGESRLPRLLDGYAVREEEFWGHDGTRWGRVARAEALDVAGGEDAYALGLFVLGGTA